MRFYTYMTPDKKLDLAAFNEEDEDTVGTVFRLDLENAMQLKNLLDQWIEDQKKEPQA
jgi:hypothetical protein